MQAISKISSLNPQQTYSYIIRDTFYQLVPAEFKQYYFYNVRTMMNWYQGYVPEFHDPRNGIFSTRIGNAIVKELTKLIVGGQVFVANKYKESNGATKPNAALKQFEQWEVMYRFQDFVKKLVEYTAAGGTAAIVLSIDDEMQLVPKVYRIDQFFHSVNFSGEVTSWTGFIKAYTAEQSRGDGREPERKNYYLLQERYYNAKNKPVMRLCVKYGISSVVSAQTFELGDTKGITWEELPRSVKSNIKHDYGDIRIGEEREIPETFEAHGVGDLGVIIARWNSANTIPEVELGESALANVLSYLIGYEQSYAEMITDLYLGRGKVLLPQAMRNPKDPNNAYYSDLDGMLFTKMPYQNESEQKPLSIQFELRAEEWVRTRNNFAENIASQTGVSGSDMFSFLKDSTGSSKTATQIASEAQKTISYIEEKRAIFKQVIDSFIAIWKNFYGVKDDFGIKFSSQNHVNMLVTTEQVRVMHEVGFPYFDIFSKMFPDYDEEQIQQMVDRKYMQEKKLAEITAEVNAKAFNQAIGEQQPNEKKEKPMSSEKEVEEDEEAELDE